MAYDYEGRGKDHTREDGSTFHVPVDTDVADAPLAFQDFAESIPFSEYVNVVTINGGTRGTQVVAEEDNGKTLFVTADTTLDFSSITSEGFTVAAVADAGATITFSGTNNDRAVEAYKVATVVRVNGTNILSVAGEGSSAGCPECPDCPDTPSAAVIGGATGAVQEYSFTDSGQAYDVYEFTGSGQLNVTSPGLVEAMLIGAGGAGAGYGAGGGAGGGDAAGRLRGAGLPTHRDQEAHRRPPLRTLRDPLPGSTRRLRGLLHAKPLQPQGPIGVDERT